MEDQTTPAPAEERERTGTATYSPEDNKLRLYVGRVPRDEYLALRAEGWTSTPKQSCDFVAHWTPDRRDTALSYAPIIEDEDQSPEDRAADRAERFGEYRDKRTTEATGRADSYDAGPSAHGYQSQARAERAARRHDRLATYACDAWSKAEYWQRRTAGVIAHALYVSAPGVRMGRIKTLEAEQRKMRARLDAYAHTFASWKKLAEIEDPAEQTAAVLRYVGSVNTWAEYMHPRAAEQTNEYRRQNKLSIYSLMSNECDPITGAEAVALWFSNHGAPRTENDWTRHYELRLAYERQMLEAQGGRLEQFEVLPGGKLGGKLIIKVSKSTVTGRATSADVIGPKVTGWTYRAANIPGTDYAAHKFDLERLAPDAYTPPTPESLAELAAFNKARKANAPKKDACPLINPTDEDAERLQAIWNAARSSKWGDAEKPVTRITQAQYSANSGGSYSAAETKLIAAGGLEPRSHSGRHLEPAICKVRFLGRSVIILTDKPQKKLPAEAFEDPRAAQLAIVQDAIGELQNIDRILRGSMSDASQLLNDEQRELFRLARLVGYAYYDSLSQRGWTTKALEFYKSKPIEAEICGKRVTIDNEAGTITQERGELFRLEA